MKKKIGVVSLGCPKNLVDSEIMLGTLKREDFEITAAEKEAEIIIVNTCGFIESAKRESIHAILEMAALKKDKCEVLIVTGCLAERYKDQIIDQIPEVDAVVGTGGYGEICEIIKKAYEGNKTVSYGKLDALQYLENERLLSTGKGYAYLKIAEGCDNCCTYCIIPSLRGHYRSRKLEDLAEEARRLAQNGVRELILVAQDVTRYGTDLYGKRTLVDLIEKLGEIEQVEWIRLLYCYPEEIDESLIRTIAAHPKVCKYLDIPIQHASDKILKTMGRRGTSREISKLLDCLREQIPGVVIRTSLIVGFPGEEEADFQLLSDFVQKHQFDHLGVFTYSREEDTPAARLKPQVPKKVKEARMKQLMVKQKEIVKARNDSRMNKTYRVLVEGVAEDGIFYFGRSYGEAPEIDNVIYFTSPEPLEMGSFVGVKILNTDDYDLIGEVNNEFTE